MAATPEIFPVKNAPGVTITTPPGLSYEEARKAARIKADLLETQYGSRDNIPAGEYGSQEGITDTPTGDEPWSFGEYSRFGSGFKGLGSALKTAADTGFNFGIFRDPVTDEDIKAKQLIMQQEALDEANISGPRVQFMDILGEWNRQDILDELNYEKLSDEEKQKYKESLPGYDLDAPEKSITNMVARWAIGGITESVPWMAPQLAGGYTAMQKIPDKLSKIPVVGKRIEPFAKGAAFAVGATIAGMPQFFGSNLERSIQEGKLTADELNKPGAFGAAIGQSAADSLFYAIIGRYGGALQRTTTTELLKNIGKGIAQGGLTEVPTEILQQVLERAQAGLPISPADEEALREYIEAGSLALVAGGTLGGGVRGVQSLTAGRTEGPSLAFSDMSDMAGTLQRVRESHKAAGLQKPVEFSIDIPEGPIPFTPLAKTDTPVVEEKLKDVEKELLDYIDSNPNITIEDIQTKFRDSPLFPGFGTERKITSAINSLVEKNLIADWDDNGIIKFVPVPEKEGKRVLAANTITVRPNHVIYAPGEVENQTSYPFEALEGDATVRLFYGKLDQKETGELDKAGEPKTETVVIPLVDPETGIEVFKDYTVQEFIPPGKKEPDPRLLDRMQIKIKGDETVYRPIWQAVNKVDGSPIGSFAKIPMSEKPQMRVERKRFGPLGLLNRFKKDKTDFDAVPENATEVEIQEQAEAKVYLNYLRHRAKSWFVPEGNLPMDEWEALNKQKWLNRGELREIQSLNTEMRNGLKQANKLFKTVEQQIEFKQGTMELLEKYWSSSEDVTLQDLKKLGHGNKFISDAVEMRRLVNKNSELILSLLNKLDPKKKKYSPKLRKVIKERIGSYMTQAYGMYSDPLWKRPNRLGATPQERKNHAEAVSWLANRLRNENQLLPGENARAEAEKLLNRFYDKEQSQEVLSSVIGETIEMEPLPEIISKDLTGARVDAPQGILEPKTTIPKAIRKVMGEIKDPGTRMILTVARQAEFINGLTALNDLFKLANEPGNRWVSRIPSGRFDTPIAGSELNPFAGYYTTEPIAMALNDAIGSGLVGNAFQREWAPQTAFDIYKGAILIPQTWTRGGKILYSPFTQTRNLVSAMGFVTVNGHFPINANMKQALIQAGAYVRGLTPAEAKRLVDLGVMNTSPLLGDMARTYELAGRMDSVNGVIEVVGERQRTLSRPFKGVVGEFVRKTYQFGDDFWKVMMYLGELQKFTKAFAMPTQMDTKSEEYSVMVEENIKIIEQLMERGERRPLQLSSSTPEARLNEALEELAAYRTRQNVPNYDYIGRFGEVVRLGPTGDFVAFPTEQVRTSWNTVTSGIHEIKIGRALQEQGGRKAEIGKQITRRGWARVISYTLYNSTLGVSAKALALGLKSLKWGAYGALGMFAADWGRDRNEMILEIDSRTGVIRTMDTSSADAYDVITEPLRAMIRGVTSGDSNWEKTTGAVKGLGEGLYQFFSQYFSPSIYAKAFAGVIRGTDERGKKFRDEDESLTKRGLDTIKWFYDEVQPGISTTLRQMKQAEGEGAERLDRFNRERTIQDVAKRGFGAIFKERSLPKDWASFQLTDFLTNTNEAFASYKAPQYRAGSEALTVADIIEAYNLANETYYNLVLNERKRINAAGELSIPPEVMFNGIPRDRYKNISKRNRANLQLDDASNDDGSYDDVAFTPFEPKDFFEQTKQRTIEELALKGERDERLERMEFPDDALMALEEMWGERILEGYAAPGVQSEVMNEALKGFGFEDL